MRIRLQDALAVGLALLGGAAFAQDKPAAPAADAAAAATAERMKKDLFFLAGPECEGRGLETEGINRAADYIARSFAASGLKPATADGSYFQPFTVAGRSKLDAGHSVKFAGPDGREAELRNMAYTVSALCGGKTLPPTGIVFAGYGITKEGEYDDYAGLDVAGKAVVIFRRTPRFDQKDALFDTNAYGTLVPKVENAEKHKAAMVIFVNTKASGGPDDTLMDYSYGASGTVADIPVVHVKRATIDEMLGASKGNLANTEANIDRDLKPQSRELAGWTAECKVGITRTAIPAKNVIGVLDGAGPLADETLVIGAHYDHLGRGEPGAMTDTRAVHFGADDNASGTCGVLELARRFAAVRDRQGRRLVFMTFSGEERGLLGSVYYCKHPLFPLAGTAAMLNMDMIGRLSGAEGKNKLEVGGVGTAAEFEGLIDALNGKYGFPIAKSKTGNGPSDHQSFNQFKVPVFFFFTGIHGDYHRPTDTPDRVNLDGMKRITDMVGELATGIAAQPAKPKFLEVAGTFSMNGSGSGRGPTIGLIPGAGAYDDGATDGVPVGGARKDSPADKAGLKEGDTIVEVGGTPVKNITAYMNQMAKQKRGGPVAVVVLRGGRRVTLTVDLPK